jgi:Zn2+/Cd2+-exporting ATPase
MTQRTYTIGNMDCANCAREVEDGVRRLDGVSGVRVDFASAQMTLTGDVSEEILRRRVEALGKTLGAPPAASRGGVLGFWDYLLQRWDTRLALFGGAGILLTLLLSLVFPTDATGLFYTGFMLVVLFPIARSGFNSLLINRAFNINLLMTIAAVGAVLIGEYLEAATVIFLFAIGEALEGYTADRARHSLRSLLDLAPLTATRRQGAHEETVPVAELAVGDLILVQPGERVPMDGEILAGHSSLNQAPITGESMPVDKTAGDTVFAGTINGQGALEIRVTHLAADNTLNRIIQLVSEAQSQRAPSQRLIDRFAQIYTPAVVVLAALVATLPPLLFGAPFLDTPETHGWFYRALSMLVIACPCALVISTPVTVISAITAAARRGVLIKGGAHLEALGQIKAIAFDKTGTLTAGTPVVTALRSVDCQTSPVPCPPCADLLALAAAVEKRSTHPLAQAIVRAAEEQQVHERYAAANVEVLAGRGIQGQIADRVITIGNHRLFDAKYPHTPDLCAQVDSAEALGQTAMLLSDGAAVRGYIAVADQPRPDSAAVVQDLNTLGMHTVMLTGDNARSAAAIGQAVGVADVRADLLPEDKVAAVQNLRAQYERVAMVGDGINDTPALAAATVGIAMGGAGTAQALETADIALMADDLQQLPFAVRLSRFTRRLIRQNITLSLGLKAVFLALAVTGSVSLWAAVFADVGMALIVTLNGMRPLRQR